MSISHYFCGLLACSQKDTKETNVKQSEKHYERKELIDRINQSMDDSDIKILKTKKAMLEMKTLKSKQIKKDKKILKDKGHNDDFIKQSYKIYCPLCLTDINVNDINEHYKTQYHRGIASFYCSFTGMDEQNFLEYEHLYNCIYNRSVNNKYSKNILRYFVKDE